MNAVFLLLILSMVACEKSPQQARRDLVKLDYSYSRNSMVEAIRKGDAESTRLFLVAGMEPGTVSAGYSMLEHAAASADQAIVAILLEAGADPGASGGVSTPLIEASSRGNTGIAQQLLTAGADVNGIDGTGRTPLMAAAEQGAVGLVEVLLKAGADPNIRSKLGSTALGQAEQAQRQQVVGMLTEAGAVRAVGIDLAALMEPASLIATAPAEYRVRFATTAGAIVVAVERRLAPRAADRFFNLVRHGFFDDQRYFRVVRGRLVQFGLHSAPEVASRWYEAPIPDDPRVASNVRGTLTFATGAGADSRTTQIFINLADNADFDRQGFVPFARVVSGIEAAESINGEYGELPEQSRILAEGGEYLDRFFPALDRIIEARLLE
ncbi:MAG: hypothetical protein HOL51_16270 [Gemmatimonadetes bacterium]|jgi:peptidyl-prolyl cis-trans isomerase A (cyclophilin A)|nr:hypothetical protein [Gemmatimonadota bacterium]MBT5449809.1 hypothetical protein [Gemmatimonadota bacterium]MBT5800168.1 hypothetical protein [Gemmatimonadota bacterium]MBT7417066.1 hypothetical protein [Gemmatimonadota bacterium]MBT7552524.1 hypothetical protein [Gemmatimonadota bacterium]